MIHRENTATPVSGNADSQPPPKMTPIIDPLEESKDMFQSSETSSPQQTNTKTKFPSQLASAPPPPIPAYLMSSRQPFKELTPVAQWNEQDVFEWIQRLGTEYNADAKRLMDAKISGYTLQNLTPELFSSLVASDEHRQRIHQAIKQHDKSVKVALAEKATVASREAKEKIPA